MDGRRAGWRYSRMDEEADGQMDEGADGGTDAWMKGHTDKQMDRWMD